MDRVYQIEEGGSFVSERQARGCVPLPASTFAHLESFLLSARDGEDPLELMGISARRGAGRMLTARGYVGVIALRDGAVIEILPKICSPTRTDDPRGRARRLLIDMLDSLPDAPFRALQSTGVDAARMNLLDAFVRMFIDELFPIAKRGLCRSYERAREDARYLRGKLDLSRQIRANAAHRERFAVVCDRYGANRPENRLLKSTLLLLLRQARDARNRGDLRLLLDAFDAIPPSADVAGDLARCVPDRAARDYGRALLWCRTFLSGLGFTPFAGEDEALALLFPMEKLFEHYVTRLMRRELAGTGLSLTAQDGGRCLFDEPRRFRLRPDIVVRRGSDDPARAACFLFDAKWKLLRAGAPNFGVSQADMYQMCAYQRRFGAASAALVYPWTESAPPEAERTFSASDGAEVHICFFDLCRPRESARALVAPLLR